MRIIHTFLFSILLFSTTLPTLAEDSPFKGGMQYTAIKNKSQISNPDSTIQKDNNINTDKHTYEQNEKSQIQSNVWKKYKTLAAGNAEKDIKIENKNEISENKKPKETAEKPTPTPAPTGLAGIIQQYHHNKEQRKEMKTLTMTKPKNLE